MSFMSAMEILGEGYMLFATPAFLSVWKSKYLPGLAQVWPVKEVAGACRAGSPDSFYSQKKGIIRSLASAIHPNPSNDSYQRIHSAIALLWCTYWHFNTLKGKLRCSPTADTGMELVFFLWIWHDFRSTTWKILLGQHTKVVSDTARDRYFFSLK